MSPGCFVCRASCFAETESFTYGLAADDVLWQIVPPALLLALAVASQTAAAAPAVNPSEQNSTNLFIELPLSIRW
jgi:hypothetical protein